MILTPLGVLYKWKHTVFVLLCLTYFTQLNVCKVHPCSMWQDFLLFKAHSYSIVCTYHIFFIQSSVDRHLVASTSWLLGIMLQWNGYANISCDPFCSFRYVLRSGIRGCFGLNVSPKVYALETETPRQQCWEVGPSKRWLYIYSVYSICYWGSGLVIKMTSALSCSCPQTLLPLAFHHDIKQHEVLLQMPAPSYWTLSFQSQPWANKILLCINYPISGIV